MNYGASEIVEFPVKVLHDIIIEKNREVRETSREINDFIKYITSVSGIIIGVFSSFLLSSTSLPSDLNKLFLLLIMICFTSVIYLSVLFIFHSRLISISKEPCFFEKITLDFNNSTLYGSLLIYELMEETKKQISMNKTNGKRLFRIIGYFVTGVTGLVCYVTANLYSSTVEIFFVIWIIFICIMGLALNSVYKSYYK